MKKYINKLFILLITMFMMFSANICLATDIPDEEYIAKFLVNIGVINGYEDRSLHLEYNITREEFSKIIVLVSTFKDDVDLFSRSSPFPDVTKERWSSPYVKVAAINNILKGYPDGQFKPTNNITVEEAAVIALRILNYTSNDYGISWPYSQLSFAKDKHILDNVSKSAGQNISRQDAVNIIYNTLCSNINGSDVKYINFIDYITIDDVIIMASKNQDKSIDSNKILTSLGLYDLAYNFDNTVIGSKSTIILNKNNEIVSIIPYNQNKQKYSIITALSNGIIVSENGLQKNINIDSNITTYYKSQKTTLKTVSSQINAGDIVYIFYDNNMQINYLLIDKSNYTGPYVVKNNNWINEYNLENNVSITKDGKAADIKDVELNDVIYVYNETNEVLVFSNKVSGVIEDILPTQKNANTVVISGKQYLLETVEAYNSLQNYSKGSVVTLLLGKENNVVDIIDSDKIEKEDIGLLLSCSTKAITDKNNNTITKYNCQILLTNGSVNEYIVDKDYTKYLNKIVKVIYNKDISLNVLSTKNSISGKVDSSNKKIGNNKLANNIEIIEIPKINDKYVPIVEKIYLSRLDNVTLSNSNVVYYCKNEDNEINKLIITDVTNDMYQYGIILEENVLSEYTLQTSYTFNINSNTITALTENKQYNIDKNDPVAVLMQNGTIKDINKLKEITGYIKDIEVGKITISNETYKLLSDVVVYKRVESGKYLTTNIQDVIDNKDTYNVKAYYDKLESNGGRIRVLVVI